VVFEFKLIDIEVTARIEVYVCVLALCIDDCIDS
jgi:hypothetical protein